MSLHCAVIEGGYWAWITPSAFRTNDSESINAFLKESLGYKKHQWGLFNEKVKKIIEQQQNDITKAIIGLGRYQLRPQYSYLSVSEDKWFHMSQEQRKAWIKKFNATQVQVVQFQLPKSRKVLVVQFQLPKSRNAQAVQSLLPKNIQVVLSLSMNLICQQIFLLDVLLAKVRYLQVFKMWCQALDCLEGICRKASMLVAETNSVVSAPGFSAKDKIVRSKSGSSPH